MDYHNETTTLSQDTSREITASQNPGAVTAVTCSTPPSRGRTKVPQAIHQLIGELKVRFQHTCADDPEGFKLRCGFLAEDLADAPPLLLRLAIVHWVRERPFLPTTADLTKLMRDELERRDRAAAPSPPGWLDHRTKVEQAQALCDQRNPVARNNSFKPSDHIEWFVNDKGDPALRWKQTEPPPPVGRVDPRDVDRLNRALRKFNAPFRYNRAGYDFDLKPGQPDPTDPNAEQAQ